VTEPRTITGVVTVQTAAVGSKSEQVTAVLRAEGRTWLLRRSGGPAFGIDDELAAYDGMSVTVTGYAGSGVFLVTELHQPRD
jgi:hypothetical protein